MPDPFILLLPALTPGREKAQASDPAFSASAKWLTLHGGALHARVFEPIGGPAEHNSAGVPLLALAPATTVPVHWLHYPDAPPQQAAAIAVRDIQDRLLPTEAGTHLVAGEVAEQGAAVPVAVVSHMAMKAWADWLAQHGIRPDAIVPVAALLPAPEEKDGGWIADVPGEQVVRTGDVGYASDPAIDPLLTGSRPLSPLRDAAVWEQIQRASAHPPLNLLAGVWAPRRRWSVPFSGDRLLKRMAVAALFLLLIIPLIYGARLMNDTRRANDAAVAAAQRAGIRAADAADAERQLDQRMAQRGGGPLSFSVPLSGLYMAMRSAPGVSLRSLSHRADGTLTAVLAAPRTEDMNQVLIALQARGYRVTAQPMAGNDGQQMANITVRAIP